MGRVNPVHHQSLVTPRGDLGCRSVRVLVVIEEGGAWGTRECGPRARARTGLGVQRTSNSNGRIDGAG